MGTEARPARILLVGDETSISRSGLTAESCCEVEVVGSLAEAICRRAAGGYARIVVDSAVLDDSAFETSAVLAASSHSPADAASERGHSEHRLTGDELTRSRRLLQDIIDNTPAAIYVKDLEGRLIVVNRALAELLGYDKEAMIGKTSYDFYPHEVAEQHVANDRAVMQTGEPFTAEETVPQRDGNRVFISEKFPLWNEDGRVYGVGGISTEITGRKRAEEALARSQRELMDILESMEGGFITLDAEWRFTRMNTRAARNVGYDPEQLMGEVIWDRFPMLADTRMGDCYRMVMAEKVAARFEDYGVLTGRWYAHDVYPTPDGIAVFWRDITDRKRADELQQEVLEREQRIAKTLQSAIIPADMPRNLRGYQLAARHRPALREAEVGGDFYDIFEIGDDKFGILVGDVAGKGLAAAIRVAAARYSIRSYAYLDPRPAGVIAQANDALCRDGAYELNMLTLFFGVLDTQSRSLAYTNAGHEPPIVISAARCEELGAGGLALGVVPGIAYRQASLRIDSDDMLVVVTDGITEARAPGPVLFGKHRLVDLVHRSRGLPPDDVASAILAEATSHAGGQLQDDAAVVVLKAI